MHPEIYFFFIFHFYDNFYCKYNPCLWNNIKIIIFACIVRDNNSCMRFWGRYLFMVYRFLIITQYNWMWCGLKSVPWHWLSFKFPVVISDLNRPNVNKIHLSIIFFIHHCVREATTYQLSYAALPQCDDVGCLYRHAHVAKKNTVDDCYLLLPRTKYCQQIK